MKRSIILASVAVIHFASPRISNAQVNQNDTVTSTALHNCSVSLVRVIANPDQFDGFRVQASGYFHYRFEDCGLYLSKADADHLLGKNAVWVRFGGGVRMVTIVSLAGRTRVDSLTYFDGKYVTLTGTFDKSDLGHMGAFSGSLKDVDVILEDRQWYDGRKNLWKHKRDDGSLHPQTSNPDEK